MSDVPETFRSYVNAELKKEWMGTEVDRVYAKTKHGQYVCFITSKVIWYAVRVIIDEEYRHLKIESERAVHRIGQGIVIAEDFVSCGNASKFIRENRRDYENGTYKLYAFRCRSVSMNVHQNPDMYLKPGDHIQRDLDFLPFSHDGIYLGDGKVAHIFPRSDFGYKNSSAGKADACARIDPFHRFAASNTKQIRIVVHCFRRRSRNQICETARRLVEESYGFGEYDFLDKNCQHFATLCALSEKYRTDFETYDFF